MNRRSSFGRMLAWILLAVCFLPVVLRAEVQAPSPSGSPGIQADESAEPAPTTGTHRLTGVQATAGVDEVRVFLEADGNMSVHPFLLDSPDRLVVDLEDVQSTVKQTRIDVNSQVVTRVRVGQRLEGAMPVARVVLDLNAAQPYHIDPAPGGMLVTVGGGRSGSVGEMVRLDAANPAGSDAIAKAAGATAPSSGSETSTARTPGSSASMPVQNERTSPAGTDGSRMVAVTTGASSGSAKAATVTTTASVPENTMAPGVNGKQAPDDPVGKALAFGNSEPPAAPREAKLMAPASASHEAKSGAASSTFESKTIAGVNQMYTGKKISLNLVDADVKQVFRLFHEISGLNFVLDPSVSGNVTIVLDEVPWDQALDIILKNNGLDKVYEDTVIRIASTQKLASEAGGRKALREAKELEVEPVTITRRLSYAKAKDVDQIIKTGVLLSQRGKSFFDDRTNTLIITDVPSKIEPLERLLGDLDAKTPQVLIEARIVLTGRDYIQDLGIDWGFTFDRNAPRDFSNANNFPHHGEVTYALNLPRAAAASRLAFNLFNRSGSFNLQVALDALEVDGRSRTISAPKIATQNNVKAEIEQGVQIPIANSTATEINVEFVSASLKLSVTPQITAEGTVIMDVTVENNQPSKTLKLESGIPGIDTQRAQTKVMVDDGGTTVIGGIFSVNEGHSESGVPWLRKIPIFGWLFKARNISIQNRELLIFITPKILRSS